MKSTLRKSVRIYKRRSVSDRYVEDGICLDKSFEDSSFQAVYQKISKEMKVSIIPEKKTDEEPKKFKTQQQNRRLFISVRKQRPQLNTSFELQTRNNTTAKRRRGQSVSGSLSNIKMSEDPPSKIQQNTLQQIVMLYGQLNMDYPHVNQLVEHCRKVQNILQKLQNLNVEKLFENVRDYVLDDEGKDISKLHLLFNSDEIRRHLKFFLFYQRISVLFIVEAILRKRLKFDLSAIRGIFDMLFDTYVEIAKGINKIKPINDNIVQIRRKHQSPEFFHLNEAIKRKLLTLLKNVQDLHRFYNMQLKYVPHQTINKSFYRILEYYAMHLIDLTPHCYPPTSFLATCPAPYLHNAPQKPYTLVLDLDETLVHFNMKNTLSRFGIRPYCQQFLFQMAQHYEIGIFTCGTADYAEWATSHLKGIDFKLYRHHTIQVSTGFLKDLNRIGRDLSKMIIVDNLPHNFQLHPQNGIEIKPWFNDEKDTALLEVMDVLKYIADQKAADVRQAMKQYAQKYRK